MPQPIDFQTEVARTTAVERIQTASDRASLAGQQRAATDLQIERALTEQQVLQTPEAQSEHVDEEAKRRNPYARRKPGKKDGDGEHEGEMHRPLLTDGEGQKLDVSI